jgi:hypothetical protein
MNLLAVSPDESKVYVAVQNQVFVYEFNSVFHRFLNVAKPIARLDAGVRLVYRIYRTDHSKGRDQSNTCGHAEQYDTRTCHCERCCRGEIYVCI